MTNVFCLSVGLFSVQLHNYVRIVPFVPSFMLMVNKRASHEVK